MRMDDLLRFDKRLQERNIKSGTIGPKDLEKYLTNLPDVSDNMEKLGDEEKPGPETDKDNDAIQDE